MSTSNTLVRVGNRLRFLAVAMIGAYLVLNGLMTVMRPIVGDWPLWASTAVTVPPMVLSMVYGVIPLARRLQA